MYNFTYKNHRITYDIRLNEIRTLNLKTNELKFYPLTNMESELIGYFYVRINDNKGLKQLEKTIKLIFKDRGINLK